MSLTVGRQSRGRPSAHGRAPCEGVRSQLTNGPIIRREPPGAVTERLIVFPRTQAVSARVIVLIGSLLVTMVGTGCEQRPADAPPAASARTDQPARALPLAGTEVPLFPLGDARSLAQNYCLACHASDMIEQQRLTPAQWTAEVDKMQRWGAEISEGDKAALVSYLGTHFGRDNDRFTPIVTRPE